MNIVEKILRRASGKERIKPGEIIEVTPDLVMSHDGDNIYNIESFKDLFKGEKVWDPQKSSWV